MANCRSAPSRLNLKEYIVRRLVATAALLGAALAAPLALTVPAQAAAPAHAASAAGY